jgi:Transposase zinc-ribbon domain
MGETVMATKKHIHQLTATQFDKAFPDEEACCAYLVGKRWPEGVHCPRCGAADPGELKGNPFHWQCYQCANPTELEQTPNGRLSVSNARQIFSLSRSRTVH